MDSAGNIQICDENDLKNPNTHFSYRILDKDGNYVNEQVFGILDYETRGQQNIIGKVFSPILDKQYMAINRIGDKYEIIDLGYLLPGIITNSNDHTNNHMDRVGNVSIFPITYYFFTQIQYGKASHESLNSTFSGTGKQISGIYNGVYRISAKDIIHKYHLFIKTPPPPSSGGKKRVRKSRRKRRKRGTTRRRRQKK